jgi:translation initiation factor 2 alpha subunit (eIF-2alpha)
MFYYREKLPLVGTIVVACLVDEEDNDNCIYVILPEYNNFRGIVYKRELPKRLKHQKKLLSEMKRAGQIVCIVSTTPTFVPDGHSVLIELSIKGIDIKYHPNIFTRQKNIEKLLKIVKFVSLQFGYDFEELVKILQNNELVALTEINVTEGVNNYTEHYLNHLRNHTGLLKMMNIEEKAFSNVSDIVGNMIKQTNASATLDFDMFVWKAKQDDVFVLRHVFEYVLQTHAVQGLELRYIGAPVYQIVFSHIDIKNIDNILEAVKETIISFMIREGVVGFDLKFDIEKKNIKYGDISIAFPYKIDMN